MKHINISCKRLTRSATVALVGQVIDHMTNNPHFPEPAVPLAELRAELDRLNHLIARATDGSRQDRLDRDEQETRLKTLLQKQCMYVILVSDGNASVQHSSGFPASKVPGEAPMPGTPQKVKASFTGKKGQIDVSWKSEAGAKFYRVQMTTDQRGPNNWTEIISTRRSFSFHGLQSAITYYFRIIAVGSAGTSEPSEVVFMVAA